MPKTLDNAADDETCHAKKKGTTPGTWNIMFGLALATKQLFFYKNYANFLQACSQN